VAPVTGAVFNDPNDAVNKRAVSNKLKELIGSADSGSTIRIAIYEFHDSTIKDALKAARARGVNVQVVADYESRRYASGALNPTWTDLENAFGTNKAAPSWVMTCPLGRACIGSGKLMHNKFALFSSVAGVKVVFQSSANFYVDSGGFSGDGNWNNAMTVAGNVGLYDSYYRYFGDLKDMRRTDDQYNKYSDSYKEHGNFKPYYFPRAGTDASTDTIVSVLNNVDCTKRNNVSTGTVYHQTIVRVAMAYFTRQEVADKLRSMDNAGCYVEVIYRKDSITSTVEAALKADRTGTYHGIRSWYLPADVTRTLHSKYLAIEGNYVGYPDMKLVWTGSHNYTYPALRGNDEVLLRVDDNGIHDAFRQNFWDITRAAGIMSN